MSAIEVRDLVVRYDVARSAPVTAVHGVAFAAEAGAVLALLGPNGAGKTTTVETLEGYRRPTSGLVRVLGLDPACDARSLAPRIGVMLQRNGVYLTMGAAEVIHLFASYYGTRALDPDALVERVGLGAVATTPWRRLSGGEQQRVSLALALVGRPEVAFLDEPTAGIDPAARLLVREIVAELRDEGVCVLLTTHDLDEASKLADRIVILDRGAVVADDTPAALMSATAGDEIRFAAPPRIDVAALAAHVGAVDAVGAAEERPGEYVVRCPPTPANVAAITGWLARHELPLGDLRAGRRTLEDVFLRLTNQESAEPSPTIRRRHRGRTR